MKITFKLKEKLILITVSAIILAIGLNTYWNINDFIGIYKKTVMERVFSQLQPLENIIKDVLDLGLELGQLEGINRECQNTIKAIPYARYCFIMDNKDEVRYHSSPEEVGSVYTDSITKTAIKSGKRQVQDYISDSGEKIYDFSLPIYKPTGERIGLIRLGIQSGIIDEQVFRLIRRTVILGIFFIFIASIIVLLLSKYSILKPIQQLMQGIAKFGRGEFDSRVELKTKDEIEELAKSFNNMAESILRYITERQTAEEELRSTLEQLKETQAQLIQTAKMASIGQLAAGLAHEINNPLTGVLNNVQLIKMEMERKADALSPAELKEVLDVIEESALRCKKITQSLLDFSHASKVATQPILVNEIVEKVINLISYELRLQNIIIQTGFSGQLPLVQGNPQLLQQVFMNLIANSQWAIKKKFGTEGGTITIKTEYDSQEDRVNIYLSDSGIGMSSETVNRLFEPFFTTKEIGEGTGLGLSVLYGIIQEHKGTIEVESELNKGTTFKMSLPAFHQKETV